MELRLVFGYLSWLLAVMTYWTLGDGVALAKAQDIRILALLWLTFGDDILSNEEIYISYAAMVVAMQHFNNRSDIMPEVAALRGRCNVKLSFVDHVFYDSTGQPNVAMSLFIRKYAREGFDIVHVVRSDVTQPIAVTAGALNVPVMSHGASADTLSNKQIYPTFFRTLASDSYKAALFAKTLQSMHYRAVGLIYIDDVFGTSFRASLQSAVGAYGIKLVASSYKGTSTGDDLVADIGRALDVLIAERVRIIYYVGLDNRMLYALAEAADERDWIDGRLYFHNRVPSLTSVTDAPNKTLLLRFLHGSLGFQPGSVDSNPVYKTVSKMWPSWNVTEINQYLPNGTTPRGTPYRYPEDYFLKRADQVDTFRSWTYAYDGIIAIGLAACAGGSLNQALSEVRFNGTSGLIRFDDQNNRQYEPFTLENIRSTGSALVAVTVGFTSTTNQNWTVLLDKIIFGDGTNNLPLDIEPPRHEIDQLTDGAIIWGGIEAAIAVGLSIATLIYLAKHRENQAFVESQPVFMFLLALGCVLMGISIIGLVVENNFGCMFFPWLFSIGFTLSLSAIIAKSARVAILWYSRGPIQKRNKSVRGTVLLGGVALAVLGLVAILTAWQVIAPLEFVVQTTKTDSYDYPLYSSAMCVTAHPLSTLFLALVITYVCLVVFGTMWVSFWVRNAPEKFQEARMTAIAGVSMFQVFFVGIPTAAAVWNMALPRFLVLSSLTFLLCLIILFTMFLPKIMRDRFGVERSSEIQQANNPLLNGDADDPQNPQQQQAKPGQMASNRTTYGGKAGVVNFRGKKRRKNEKLDSMYQSRSIVDRVLESVQEVDDSLPPDQQYEQDDDDDDEYVVGGGGGGAPVASTSNTDTNGDGAHARVEVSSGADEVEPAKKKANNKKTSDAEIAPT